MLEFAEKLTRCPWLVAEGDILTLRQAGFHDLEILQLVLGSAHFNYLNRVADGLGIELEYPTTLPPFEISKESTSRAALRNREPLSYQREKAVTWIDVPDAEDTKFDSQPRNLFRALGGNPEARDITRKWRDYQFTGTPSLDALARRRVALYVSALDQCEYAAWWHREALRGMGENLALIEELARGEAGVTLSTSDSLILRHAQHLTEEPWTVTERDIVDLRKAGWTDKAILQLTMLVAYLSFENRVALGLGVSLEYLAT